MMAGQQYMRTGPSIYRLPIQRIVSSDGIAIGVVELSSLAVGHDEDSETHAQLCFRMVSLSLLP